MIGVWPEDWRAELAAVFDAERDGPPEILVVYVAEDGRYTGDVWRIRPGETGRMEHDQKLEGSCSMRLGSSPVDYQVAMNRAV